MNMSLLLLMQESLLIYPRTTDIKLSIQRKRRKFKIFTTDFRKKLNLKSEEEEALMRELN